MEDADFTPRAYQSQLYERAINENLIIFLPTGSGKTFIAVLLIKKYSSQVESPFSAGGKRIFFIVNTVPLVTQQSKYVASHTGLITKGYSGADLVDFWSTDKWLQEIHENQVMVMTADVFLIMANHGIISLESICLMIFDECHKAVHDHPMRRIMKLFEQFDKKVHPRVLGLTATLLNGNVKINEVENTIRELEITFHAKIATVNSIGPVQHYGKLEESIVLYDPPPLYGIEEKLAALFAYMLKAIAASNLNYSFNMNASSKEFRPKTKTACFTNLIIDLKEQVETMGLYGASKAVLLQIINLEYMQKFTDDNRTVILLKFLVSQMTKMRKLMCDWMGHCSELEQIFKFSADRLIKLFALLQQSELNRPSDRKFCCIVFVQRRSTASILYNILKNLHRLSEDFKFLLPEYMVSQQNNRYNNTRESVCIVKWNREAFRRFQTHETNCMVATDVFDEGVDIPSCNLIVRYNLCLDFRSYVQSKGRARDINGTYAMLIPRSDTSHLTKVKIFKRIEEFLKLILVGHTDDRQKVSAEEIDKHLYRTEIKPYTVVGLDGCQATVTGISAIQLINRYCSKLSNSRFVTLAPTWKLYTKETATSCSYKVSLTLPSVSTLRETIDGDEMQSITLAKRSAALKTCIRLHKMQELSDRLVPHSLSDILVNTDNLFPNWENEPKEESTMTGTVAKKRQHKIIYPNTLHAAFPVAEVQLYLHIIVAKPTYPEPQENPKKVFYDLLNDDAGFAILSTKHLPRIPDFPIFMMDGELNVSVRVNASTFTLSAREISQLRVFNWLIFHNVLNIVKSFMTFDTDNLNNSFMVVPVNDKGQIDWDVVNKYKQINREPLMENTNIRDHKLSLVCQNYLSSYSVYVVTQVCEDILPESSYPTEDFHSYIHYYKEHHGLIIRDPKQPMLEVKGISTHINCIRPRSARTNDMKIHFVGELCDRINFSALYWLKASYVPSVLHRVSQLLVADELRLEIVKEAYLGTLTDQSWSIRVIKQTNNEEPPPDALSKVSHSSGDDSSIPIKPTVEISRPKIETLDVDSTLYPWAKDEEPVNVFRDIDQIRLIDIENYHQFASMPINAEHICLSTTTRFETNPCVKAPRLNIIGTDDSTGPSPGLVMEALTSKESHDIFNLERLETLGDSFLKYAASVYLFEAFPKLREGQLTTIKGKIVGNRNLFYCGKKRQIPGRLKVNVFAPRENFTPPGFCVSPQIQRLLLENEKSANVLYDLNISPSEQLTGILSEKTLMEMQEKILSCSSNASKMQHFLGQQVVSDKTVSDSVEALIGVYLSSMGLVGAVRLLSWFGVLPVNLKIDEIFHGHSRSPRLGAGDPSDHMPRASFIEKQIGYKFIDRAYLLQAFTHPSYTPNNITESYEKLEFLGDAIIDFLITAHIYETCDNLSPGELTDLRSALVNNITFACLAVKYGLHTALLSYDPKIHKMIAHFISFQEERGHIVDGEVLWILLEEEECRMAECVDVPKILGDIFESVVGAIYLDTGKDLNETWAILYGLMSKEIAAFSKDVPKQPVRLIHEIPGANPRFSHASPVDDTDSVMVTLEMTIDRQIKVFHGFGANKRQAKYAAAKQALKCIRNA